MSKRNFNLAYFRARCLRMNPFVGCNARRKNVMPKRLNRFPCVRQGKLGNADAQCGVGALYATGDPVAKDLQAAIVWYRRAARQENAEAQYNLGMMYLDGEGCAVNTARGLDWTKRAIRNGYDYAASALADMYEDGVWGVECDPKKAAYWRRLYEKSSRRT
jgi:TPR repeat protein